MSERVYPVEFATERASVYLLTMMTSSASVGFRIFTPIDINPEHSSPLLKTTIVDICPPHVADRVLGLWYGVKVGLLGLRLRFILLSTETWRVKGYGYGLGLGLRVGVRVKSRGRCARELVLHS